MRPVLFSSRGRHTILQGDWSSDVCSSDLLSFLWMLDIGLLLDASFVNIFSHSVSSLLTLLIVSSDVQKLFSLIRSHMPDRKSTRLNSSHLVISYAVFCLKKKKNYVTDTIRHYVDIHVILQYRSKHITSRIRAPSSLVWTVLLAQNCAAVIALRRILSTSD